MRSRPIQRNMFYGAKGNVFNVATLLRKNMTLAELILWKRIRERDFINVKFRRQHPIDIFIVDFYCHELKLVIEIDGEVHLNQGKKDYEIGREEDLKKYGIKIIRFSNDQILYDIEDVLVSIKVEILKSD